MVLNYIRFIVFGGLLLACGSTSQEKEASPTVVDENEPLPIEEARTVYTLNCASCHGQDGTAQISNAADLSKSKMDVAAIEKTIRKGNDKGMMPYEEMLTVGEIKGLVAFVETLRKK
jgi:mono/diheme cytochrome c family protein